MSGCTNWLTGLSGARPSSSACVLGLMMCFDLGGPVNKAAYLFATRGPRSGTVTTLLQIMAAVMAAGMVPPLAMALVHRRAPEALHRRPSARTARRRGCWARRSSPRARSRSPRPTRCASSPR